MQVLADGIIATCAFLPVALGFFIFYRVSGILHFAHGALVPISGFSFLTCIAGLGLSVFGAVLISILIAVSVGLLIERTLYRPLRNWDKQRLATFVVSFGAYIVIVGILSLIFGDATRVIQNQPMTEGLMIFGARASVVRLLIVGAAIGAMLATWLFLHGTTAGLYVRAIASNTFLARAIGVPTERTHQWAIGIGSTFAGMTGILTTFDVGIAPNAGMAPLLLGVIAVFVGGRTEFGVLIGALIIGVSQHVATVWIPAKWQDTIAFVLLVLVLLFRPGGLVGRPAPELES
jgi:branched-subunit amino acid ABC-type transport system permease component